MARLGDPRLTGRSGTTGGTGSARGVGGDITTGGGELTAVGACVATGAGTGRADVGAGNPEVATTGAGSRACQRTIPAAMTTRPTMPPTTHGHRARGSRSVAIARGKEAAARAGAPRCCSARLSASRM